MAARKKKVEAPADPAVQRVGVATVRRVPVDKPVAMVTLGPEHGAWEGAPLPGAHGAIVRIVPPADATDEAIGGVLDRLKSLGVLTAKLMPREGAAVVALAAAPRPVRRRHREVVEAMVAEAAGVDRAALSRVVASIMDEEGL